MTGSTITITVEGMDARHAARELQDVLRPLGFDKMDLSAERKLHQLHQALHSQGIDRDDLMQAFHNEMAAPSLAHPRRWLSPDEAKAIAEHVEFHRPGPDIALQVRVKQTESAWCYTPDAISDHMLDALKHVGAGEIIKVERSLNQLLEEAKTRLEQIGSNDHRFKVAQEATAYIEEFLMMKDPAEQNPVERLTGSQIEERQKAPFNTIPAFNIIRRGTDSPSPITDAIIAQAFAGGVSVKEALNHATEEQQAVADVMAEDVTEQPAIGSITLDTIRKYGLVHSVRRALIDAGLPKEGVGTFLARVEGKGDVTTAPEDASGQAEESLWDCLAHARNRLVALDDKADSEVPRDLREAAAKAAAHLRVVLAEIKYGERKDKGEDLIKGSQWTTDQVNNFKARAPDLTIRPDFVDWATV